MNDRENYIFNSGIEGIEQSDLILLIGTNPRLEATILNSRIRKSYLNNNNKIYSVGDIGDLTYPYKVLPGNTKTIKDIIENKSEISKEIKNAKKPAIILGQSVLKMKSGAYIFEQIKKYLYSLDKINNEWNSLNIMSNHASTVGGYDLNLITSKEDDMFNKVKQNYFEIVFLFGQENIKINNSEAFVIYVGSHGDKGAEQSNLILPSAAYTEQDGYFTNLEGKLQKAFKASYPPGDAKEEWQIINELSFILTNKHLYSNQNELEDSMLNYLNLNRSIKEDIIHEYEFYNENIKPDYIDYYFSNAIARSSSTMMECRQSRNNFGKTGTEG